MAASGKVYLVGAGPGSPDLISVRGFRALVKADAIIFDSLLPASFLDELGIQGEGKELRHLRRRGARESQDEINGLMGEWASRGMTVVRLKGGDPGVFGCLNEEIAFLSGRGIPWEVVPGPSVCTAALSAAGLPLTLRGEARSFAAVTARGVGGDFNETYPVADTLVVYMGVATSGKVAAQLMSQGWDAATPCLFIERACTADEHRVPCRLNQAGEAAGAVSSPAILIVGKAARAYLSGSAGRALGPGQKGGAGPAQALGS